MGVRLFIRFDNEAEYFYPGQLIQGIVTLNNDSDIRVKGLTITFYGDVDVYYTEAEARADTVSPHRNQGQGVRRHVHKEYSNHETILCDEIVLLGQGEAEGGTDFVLSRGFTEYSFQYQLPFAGLPSTFTESPFGTIRYAAEARLKRPLFRYDKVEKEFVVRGLFDINAVPKTMQPFGTSRRIEFGWMCCPEGYLTLDVQLPKTGYTPNENISCTVSVMNTSLSLISQISCSLTQDIEFRTFNKTKRLKSDLKYVALENNFPTHGIVNWSERIVVPIGIPPSTLTGPSIISFQYYLKVTVKISNKTCIALCPIFIGSETCDILHAFALTSTQTVTSLNSVVPTLTNEAATVNVANEYNPRLNPFLNTEPEEENNNSEGVQSRDEIEWEKYKNHENR